MTRPDWPRLCDVARAASADTATVKIAAAWIALTVVTAALTVLGAAAAVMQRLWPIDAPRPKPEDITRF